VAAAAAAMAEVAALAAEVAAAAAAAAAAEVAAVAVAEVAAAVAAAAAAAAAAAEVAATAAAVAAAVAAAAAAAVVRVADQITANPGLTTYHSAQTNKQFPFNKLPFLQLLHVCWAHSSKENIWGQFRNAFCRRPDALPVVQATVSEH